MRLGDDGEGGAVSVPLYPVVNRAVRELWMSCRGWFVSLGSCGVDAQIHLKRQGKPENGFNKR